MIKHPSLNENKEIRSDFLLKVNTFFCHLHGNADSELFIRKASNFIHMTEGEGKISEM